jgi:hypothetical protein
MPYPRVRGLFATGKAMPAPLIGHDGKRKTVTFGGGGADGPTEGAYRTARMWSRIGTSYAVMVSLLTIVSMWMLVDFATDLATTWAEVVKFSLIAIVISLALAVLPGWATLVEERSPSEGRLMMMAWLALLAIAGAAMLFVVVRMDGAAPQALSGAATARADELRKSLRYIPQAEYAVWKSSGDCRSPRDTADRATCDAITARDAEYRSELSAIEQGTWKTGWTPRDLIGTGRVASFSEFLRRLIAALLTILAIAAPGILTRWGAVGHDVAFQRADGITPGPAVEPSASAGNPPALISPLESTEMWLATRVAPMKGMRMRSSDGYADYLLQAEASGFNPLPKPAFYRWLAARVTAPDLRDKVKPLKSNGNTVYDGLCLGTADMGVLPAADGDMLALPYRTE